MIEINESTSPSVVEEIDQVVNISQENFIIETQEEDNKTYIEIVEDTEIIIEKEEIIIVVVEEIIKVLEINEAIPGLDGKGIVSINKTATAGLIDTYTILFTDDSTSTFDIINGKIGEDGKSAYQIWLEQGNAGTEQSFIDSLKGTDGKSAYELAVKGGYTGTEEQFNYILSHTSGINTGDQDLSGYVEKDLSNGTVTRDTNNIITSVVAGKTLTPTRDANGYIQSITDGIYTWTFTRNASGFIESWVIA